MHLRRTFAAVAALAVVGAACGTTPSAEAPGTDVASATTGTSGGDAPVAIEVAADPTALLSPSELIEDAPLPATVTVTRPDLLIRPPADANSAALYNVLGDEAVEQLTGAAEFDVLLVQDEASTPLHAFGIDPVAFRSMTPEVTANAVGVWQRLAEGDVVVRHDVAHRLGLELGGSIVLQGPDTSRLARIGAFASTGTPPVADILVPWDLGRELGGSKVNLLVVAVAEGQDDATVGKRLIETVGGGDYVILVPPAEQQATLSAGNTRRRFEAFSYVDLGDGMIVISPTWVRKWITTVDLPRVGRARVHKLIVPQLMAAIDEITAAGLLDHFKPEQFGGGWVPRHIDWAPTRGLSMHAWGLAVDFNTHDNWLGEVPQMDMRIVNIFEKWGFAWGGRWSRPDGMHFELAALVDPS